MPPLLATVALALTLAVPAVGHAAQFRVWADANAASGPGINSSHTLVYGFGNLFLSQDGVVYNSTGPTGSTPGTFAMLGTLPNSGSNEGSAVFTSGATQFLFVGNESYEELYGLPVTGSGAAVSLGSATTYDGETTPESGDTGQFAEFDEVEGAALFTGTPVFDDVNTTPMFASAPVAPGVMVNGNSFPMVNANWSGRTLLLANEDEDNVIAFMVLNDGTVSPVPGIALGQPNAGPFNNISNADALTVTSDGRFAYLHDENESDFYRIDLQHVDSTGGSSHIQEFDFPSHFWVDDALLAVGTALYIVANDGGTSALYRVAIDPATGNLGSPVLVGPITDGQGHTATGSSGRLAALGNALLISDDASGLVFQFDSATTSAAPVLSHTGLLASVLVLLLVGAVGMRRRQRCA